MRIARCKPIAVLLLALHVAACTYWQPSAVGPRQLLEEERPSAIRVTTTDGEQLTVRAPELRRDSVAAGGREPVDQAVAVSDIQSIDVRRVSAGQTIGLIVLIGLGALVGTYIYVCAELCGSR